MTIVSDSLAQVIAGPRPSGILIMLMGTGWLNVAYTYEPGWQIHEDRHHAPNTHYIHLSERCTLWRLEADEQTNPFDNYCARRPLIEIPAGFKLSVCVAHYTDGKISDMILRPAVGVLMENGQWR